PVHVYGLTETYGPHTVCAWHADWDRLPADEMARKAARQGQGYVVFDLVRVVDDAMRDVAMDGETLGEVVMRGNNVMKGYFEQPDASAEAFRGGWFHSGDIAVWHPDGYIELRDRKKDIIISGGENISTIEVEQTVAKHPAVLECAVVAVPDDKWGERPKAFVTLKPGRTATAGQGKLIMFAHGFPEFWYAWKAQLAEFERDHQAVALDMRGYNLSSKPPAVEQYAVRHLVEDLRALAEALGHRRLILVGHDWGGATAWAFAIKHPEWLEKLVIINAPHPAVFAREL